MHRARPALVLVSLLALAFAGCAKNVQVPPRVDLGGFGTLGIARFETRDPGRHSEAAGDIAFDEFIAYVHAGQPGTPIVELHNVSAAALQDPAVMRRIAKKRGIDTLILGNLRLTEVKPKVKLGKLLTEGSVEASIQGALSASIVDAKSGATRWSNTARLSRQVAHLGLKSAVRPTASINDVDETRARLVRDLTEVLTRDFRPRWVKER